MVNTMSFALSAMKTHGHHYIKKQRLKSHLIVTILVVYEYMGNVSKKNPHHTFFQDLLSNEGVDWESCVPINRFVSYLDIEFNVIREYLIETYRDGVELVFQ